MPSITQLIRKSMLLIIVLTAMTDALYICSLVISAKCNMYARLSMAFVFDGTITKIIIGSTLEKNHVCNTYLKTYTTLI